MNMQNNLKPTCKNLTLRQQFLLSKFYDNECNFIEGYLAKRLVNSNDLAREFIDGLKFCSNQVAESIKKSEPLIIANLNNSTINNQNLENNKNFNSLWDNIERKIQNEERAAIYLGGRDLNKSPLKNKGFYSHVSWSFGGALAGFLIFFVVYGQNSKYQDLRIDNNLPKVMRAGTELTSLNPEGKVVAQINNRESNNPNTLRQVASGFGQVASNSLALNQGKSDSIFDLPSESVANSKLYFHEQSNNNESSKNAAANSFATNNFDREEIFDATPYLAKRILNNQNAFKIDWLRSNGSVRVIQQDRSGAPIIWISKRSDLDAYSTIDRVNK